MSESVITGPAGEAVDEFLADPSLGEVRTRPETKPQPHQIDVTVERYHGAGEKNTCEVISITDANPMSMELAEAADHVTPPLIIRNANGKIKAMFFSCEHAVLVK